MSSYSQECNCKTNFIWVKKTFEENDAGFSHVIKSKGELVYEKHNEVFSESTKNITDRLKCLEALNKWLTFFRSGHVSLRLLDQESNHNNNKELTDEEIIKQYKDWESIDIDLKEFEKYLTAKEVVDYEGIWTSGSYKFGIKKIENDYIGFIIEADGVYWTKGQVKFKIKPDNSSIYYMKDHSEQKFSSTELIGNNYLQTGYINLKRISQKFETSSEAKKYYKAISAEKPYFEMIDEKTSYLRIPTFRGSEKKAIDSVLLVNKEQLLKTPNLIIDIRNNGGGSDNSHYNLMSLLYTNPIRTVGVEYYSTVLNNQRMMDFINKPEYGFNDKEKKWAKESFDKLSKKIGEFVNLNSNVVSIKNYDKVHQFPKNVGIIINENNGSTAEQFLLAAKQSKKVKLYGTTTTGVLDISNMYFVKSPSKEFELGYSLTRSMRIPGMAIDGIGIQPDYYIDESIPKYKWIDFVDKSLNNK